MTLSFSRIALVLALATGAQATTINFTTNNASGTCFTKVYDDVASGCQANGINPALPLSFSNAQGDSATVLWVGFTNSIGFATGPIQNVNYGRFVVGYTSNGGDTAPVTLPQLSLLLIIKEISPLTIFYPAILAELTGVSSGAGSVGPGATDLRATFTSVSVNNHVDTTFLLSPATQALNGPNIGSGQTVITGQIEGFAAPEPATWFMLSTAVPLFLRFRRCAYRKVCGLIDFCPGN